MSLQMDYQILFRTAGVQYRLMIVSEIEIVNSVENLADKATIVLPEAVMNRVLNFEDTISRGSEVEIKLGYNGLLEHEFTGFVQDITTNDSSLKIICEDALFLFRVGVKDVQLKPTSVKKIAQYLIDQVNPAFTVNCDFDITYEKFVIHQATAYDVLKKLQEETKANIYFDTVGKVLHIHPPFVEKGSEVAYSMQHNVETSSLEYKRAIDRKVEVTIESIDTNGKVKKYTTGTTGGDKITLKVGAMSEADMKKVAAAALQKNSFDGYEGSISTWLIPYVRPTYSAKIKDEDYPDKSGVYYVISVTTTFSESGGKRDVKFGIKLS